MPQLTEEIKAYLDEYAREKSYRIREGPLYLGGDYQSKNVSYLMRSQRHIIPWQLEYAVHWGIDQLTDSFSHNRVFDIAVYPHSGQPPENKIIVVLNSIRKEDSEDAKDLVQRLTSASELLLQGEAVEGGKTEVGFLDWPAVRRAKTWNGKMRV